MPTLSVTVQALRGHQAIGRQEDDGVLPLDRPVATGGDGLGFNGGHLLLLGWGACFKSSLIAAAQARDIEVQDLRLAIRGETTDGPARFSALHMDVELVTDSGHEDRQRLVQIAEHGCIVSNTLSRASEMTIQLTDAAG